MLGCSCLKQKVVLLKNLDGSDSSPSYHGHNRKRKRKRRMKMAYSKWSASRESRFNIMSKLRFVANVVF